MTPPPTLPDLLRDGLDIVFVGINPSLYSVAQGHYFARRANRFWPCFSRSVLSAPARRGLGVEFLTPEHDRRLPEYGFGFTDVVKRATARADEVSREEFAAGAAVLGAKLARRTPHLACFHGVTGYRPMQRILTPDETECRLGLQSVRIGATRIFVVPNPSPANAHFTPADQVAWYDKLAACLGEPG
jgi:double-stranded uracil-DNA glycosylase